MMAIVIVALQLKCRSRFTTKGLWSTPLSMCENLLPATNQSRTNIKQKHVNNANMSNTHYSLYSTAFEIKVNKSVAYLNPLFKVQMCGKGHHKQTNPQCHNRHRSYIERHTFCFILIYNKKKLRQINSHVSLCLFKALASNWSWSTRYLTVNTNCSLY